MKNYLNKLKGDNAKLPPLAKLDVIIWSGIGGILGIGMIGYLTHISNIIIIMAPFGATCVLAFAIPESPLAQPRNIIGGHLISTFIGLVCLYLLGNSWWSVAIAVGLSISLMLLTRTTHPPAGADPIVVILTTQGWAFLLTPVLVGSILLVVIAVLFNNLIKDRQYPKYWI